MDVQGAELLVLQGSEQMLKHAKVVFAEINFNSLYSNDVLFNEMIEFMSAKDFRLYGIENVSQSVVDGSFLQADAYFVKK